MDLKAERLRDRALLDTYHSKLCTACGRQGCDPAHIRSRGAFGDDAEWNVMPLCRAHHVLQHARGWKALAEEFPTVEFYLKMRGWSWDGRKLVRSEGRADG